MIIVAKVVKDLNLKGCLEIQGQIAKLKPLEIARNEDVVPSMELSVKLLNSGDHTTHK